MDRGGHYGKAAKRMSSYLAVEDLHGVPLVDGSMAPRRHRRAPGACGLTPLPLGNCFDLHDGPSLDRAQSQARLSMRGRQLAECSGLGGLHCLERDGNGKQITGISREAMKDFDLRPPVPGCTASYR